MALAAATMVPLDTPLLPAASIRTMAWPANGCTIKWHPGHNRQAWET
jgi:hypothetical protein